ncbi:MAG: phage scaffolding protein [Muribaculaceae bacterium]|nr:phage scaffolding protein [Muribaculaceae bacterium]MCM1440362.1 phage scaffolding protein [Roseburia sp.]
MLEWLKTILGDAYTEDIDKKVSEEIGKGFVARADFNTLNAEKKALADTVKDRDKQLETLKASSGDTEALKQQIATLQADNATAAKAHEAEIKRLKIDTAVDLALSAAKAKNVKAVKALLELENAELAEDGTVKGLADQIKKLAESPDSGFLFDTGKQKQQFTGFKPGEGGDGGAPAGGKEPKDMTYDELCAFLAENPDAKL